MPQNKLKRESRLTGNNLLRGWPGYRTRQNRSGLDPLDTSAESARMEGLFYRNLFTLRLRTRNPFYLILMVFFGVLPFPFFAWLLGYIVIIRAVEIFSLDFNFLISMVVVVLLTGIFASVTGALTITFILSLLEIFRIIPSSSLKVSSQKTKRREKKLPKRRKDYR